MYQYEDNATPPQDFFGSMDLSFHSIDLCGSGMYCSHHYDLDLEQLSSKVMVIKGSTGFDYFTECISRI